MFYFHFIFNVQSVLLLNTCTKPISIDICFFMLWNNTYFLVGFLYWNYTSSSLILFYRSVDNKLIIRRDKFEVENVVIWLNILLLFIKSSTYPYAIYCWIFNHHDVWVL